MAYTFLRAQGQPTGKSLVEEEQIGLAGELLRSAQAKGVDLVLPVDHVVASEARAGAATETVREIPADKIGLDIGPRDRQALSGRRSPARRPSSGTVRSACSRCRRSTPARWRSPRPSPTARRTSIVGGGDSVAAVMRSGRAGDITHISTGGGASFEFLEGRTLPGLAALEEAG